MSPKTTGYVRPEVYSLGFVCIILIILLLYTVIQQIEIR